MRHDRAKSNLHATAPRYNRIRRELERRWRREAKLARKRRPATCAP